MLCRLLDDVNSYKVWSYLQKVSIQQLLKMSVLWILLILGMTYGEEQVEFDTSDNT